MADEQKNYDIDAILDELQGRANEPIPEEIPVKKKPVFKLDLDLDSEYGEAVDTAPIVRQEQVSPEEPIVQPTPPVVHTEPKRTSKRNTQNEQSIGCLKAFVYAISILLVSGLLSYFIVVGGLDYTGLNRSDRMVDITIPEGANTKDIAVILKEEGLIEQSFVFRMYAKLNGADAKWQPGEFSVSPNMGYQLLIQSLQAAKARETVSVLIPEGFTIVKIAKRLEQKGICKETEFYRAVTEVDYSKDYDFIKDSMKTEGYESRIYKLEGFLFPDTYEFYENCSGETVVRKMLDNFEDRLGTAIRSAMSARDITMDELIILASIVQGEAATRDDMEKVSRVLYNRLNDPVNFPKLQCDSTGDYIERLMGSTGVTVKNTAYDTYEKEGLPVGAINNPGLEAIKAVLLPSEDAAVMDCYFFATDYDTGKTYFSKTYEQHVSVCKRYGIGMYG
ncbi:MAG: endolytic transglycosylase MltG [Clostridia bacterium]|nr:endolytic transglycosylase MltG [Clostridia bacterium]